MKHHEHNAPGGRTVSPGVERDILEFMNCEGAPFAESATTEGEVFAVFYGDAWLQEEFARQYGYRA